jgi:hypothetical protein
LHLDEVRHLGGFAELAKLLPDALAAVVGVSHFRSLVARTGDDRMRLIGSRQ